MKGVTARVRPSFVFPDTDSHVMEIHGAAGCLGAYDLDPAGIHALALTAHEAMLEIDRAAAEAEDRERAQRFTASDIKAGLRYFYSGDSLYPRTIVDSRDGGGRPRFIAVDDTWHVFDSFSNAHEAASRLNQYASKTARPRK